VPEAGLTANHVVFSLAVQLSVPPPVLLMVRVWFAGLALPWVAVKESAVGLAPIAGGTGAAVMVKVTGTIIVEAPVAVIVIAPL
jgi:hypothetical protein